MTRLDRYISASVGSAILLVLMVLVALASVSELLDQMSELRNRYNLGQALVYVVLKIPGSAVNYLGISVLIGCLIGMGALASRSELTVIRLAGVSKLKLFWMTLKPVLLLIFTGMLIAEYLAPGLEQIANSRKDLLRGGQARVEETGLWLRDEDDYIHANAVYPGGVLFGLARYQMADDRMAAVSFAERATWQGGYWVEENVVETLLLGDRVETRSLPARDWRTALTPDILDVAALRPEQLSLASLTAYIDYLGSDNTLVGSYQVAYWTRLLHPFSVAALLLVGLSFVYGSTRQHSMGQRIFIGVVIAVVFEVALDILGPASVIWGFPAWVAVGTPILLTFAAGLLLSARRV